MRIWSIFFAALLAMEAPSDADKLTSKVWPTFSNSSTFIYEFPCPAFKYPPEIKLPDGIRTKPMATELGALLEAKKDDDAFDKHDKLMKKTLSNAQKNGWLDSLVLYILATKPHISLDLKEVAQRIHSAAIWKIAYGHALTKKEGVLNTPFTDISEDKGNEPGDQKLETPHLLLPIVEEIFDVYDINDPASDFISDYHTFSGLVKFDADSQNDIAEVNKELAPSPEELGLVDKTMVNVKEGYTVLTSTSRLGYISDASAILVGGCIAIAAVLYFT